MSVHTLLGLLRSHGLAVDVMDHSFRRLFEQMSDAQRELVAIVAAAAYENGGRKWLPK